MEKRKKNQQKGPPLFKNWWGGYNEKKTTNRLGKGTKNQGGWGSSEDFLRGEAARVDHSRRGRGETSHL